MNLPSISPSVEPNNAETAGELRPVIVQPTKNVAMFNPFVHHRPTDDDVKGALIMIVDDEASVTLTISRHLSDIGFKNIAMVNDASQAIKKIMQLDPDLVLLDLRMPVHGLEILRTMRQHEKSHSIPVITLTGDTDTETRIQALTYGADDFLTKPVNLSELVARVRNTLCGKIYRDQLAKHSLRLENDVLRDALTEIANRRAFEYELNRRVIEWTRQRTPLSLILIDIDFFKSINDRFGHQVGDQVLCAISKEIESRLSAVDLVARYGGEEFAVILPGGKADYAKTVAEKIRKRIESKPIQVDNQFIQVTISLGIAQAAERDDKNSLINRADKALYYSKQNGRNRTCFNEGNQIFAVNGASLQSNKDASPSLHSSIALQSITDSRILVIDDEPSTSLMVRKLLTQSGYKNVQTLFDSTSAFDKIKADLPDLVLCDIHMPEVTGIDVLAAVRENVETKHIPLVFLTSATEAEIKIKTLEMGATDFINKPVNAPELVARVRNTLLAKAHLDHLAGQSSQLEREVRLRTVELYASRREAIQCLARAAENRDTQTGHHVFRVGRYAAIIASELGFNEEHAMWMEHAAQLHDVGKIGMPDHILKKPGPLTPEEYEIIKGHCTLGRKIIRNEAEFLANDVAEAKPESQLFDECTSPIMRMAAIVAETHHEKWDGTGYPHGLKGEAIPIEGRITAVADVFDAISSRRHYKDSMNLDVCFDMLLDKKGSHFDPKVIDAFFNRKEEIISTYLQYNDAT